MLFCIKYLSIAIVMAGFLATTWDQHSVDCYHSHSRKAVRTSALTFSCLAETNCCHTSGGGAL